MKRFHTSTMIGAKPQIVWDILTDVAAWPRWNTTVERVEGSVTAGGKVAVYAKISPGRAFPLRVTLFDPPRTMQWTGGMPLGLFTGRRTYSLTPQANGHTKFEMTEEFSGLMAPLITRSIPDLQPSFDEFAACLRKTAESSQGSRNG